MRPLFFLASLIAATTLSAGGCRSCSDCHDYDPPVANCECNAYGTQRAGSACGCGCGCGSHVEEGYYDEGEGEYAPSHGPMMQEEEVVER